MDLVSEINVYIIIYYNTADFGIPYCRNLGVIVES